MDGEGERDGRKGEGWLQKKHCMFAWCTPGHVDETGKMTGGKKTQKRMTGTGKKNKESPPSLRTVFTIVTMYLYSSLFFISSAQDAKTNY